MATETADGKYCYNQVFYGKELQEWVIITHKEMARLSGWECKPLVPGMFGYDNQAHSVATALTGFKWGMNRDNVASLVHDGWVTNYTYWRDNKPWETKPNVYFKPAKPLGDETRNNCASLSYHNLPQSEKDKDLMIADVLLQATQNNID